MVRAGRLREKVEILKEFSATFDGENGMETVTEYETLLHTYSEVTEIRFQDQLVASQSDWKQTLQFLIRYREGLIISNGDVIRWRGRQFEIISVEAPIAVGDVRLLARWQG